MKENKVLVLVVGFIVIVIALIFLLGVNTDETLTKKESALSVNEKVTKDESNVVAEVENEPEDTSTSDAVIEEDLSPVETVEEAEVDNTEEVVEEETVVGDPPAENPEPASESTSEPQVFNVEGKSFSFSVKEIRVKEGDTVTINFESTGGFHDWTINEFGASTQRVSTGDTSSVTFVADTAGTYEYYCSVGSHRIFGMVGTLIVE